MKNGEPKKMVIHGHQRIDDYYWLKEKGNPEVLAWLEAENKRTMKTMEHTNEFQETLFEEIKSRTKQEDSSAPYRMRDYFYYSRYEKDGEYPIHCRKKGNLEAPEEMLVDGNKEADGKTYYHMQSLNVSSEQNLLAYAEDTRGRRIYTLRFRDLDTGKNLSDVLEKATGVTAWANDNKTLFYARQDPVTLRANRIYRHTLGTDPASDPLIYEETDDTFWVTVFKSKSRRYIVILINQTLTTEYRLLDANEPQGDFSIFLERSRGHEYHLDHLGDTFFMLTNHQAKNFRICKTSLQDRSLDHWQEVIAHREEAYIESFELFDKYLVLEERSSGLTHLCVHPFDGSEPHYLDFGEPAYLAYLGTNMEFDTEHLRFGYTSMTTPTSVFHYHMETREKTLLKRQEVVGDFEPNNYRTERLWAKGHDGTAIPISVVYRKDKRHKGQNPLIVYGYGAYGSSVDPSFSAARLTLLDRGFVYAIAHIRGGQELGRDWYEGGRLMKKKNSFLDFISCAQYLRDQGYGDPAKMFAKGGSAGGLLVGAVMNMEPDLFHGVVALVPFVDVVTTMLDRSLPLTTGEYDEWGNPEDEAFYRYILSYSPYDNLSAKDYPHLLVTTGYHDSQVQYWEPAKWVAKLRELKTDTNRLLMKTDLEVGHGGPSGRFKQYRDTAFVYAFLLDLCDT